MPPIIPRDRLLALVGSPDADVKRSRVPYPQPPEVLYDPPNPDGSRKRCGNCYKFVVSGACIEVDGEINPGQVCGLFVWGTPQPAMPIGAPERKVAQPAAGLIYTPGQLGTACELCRFFSPDADARSGLGACAAVGQADGIPPVMVDCLGCCTRWEK